MEMFFGHSTSQAPVLVQLPKPSSSIFATIDLARREASTFPCGKGDSWRALADINSIADPFLQAFTHALQHMQAAASIAISALSRGIGIALASTALPVFTDTYPPACMI